MSKYLYSTMILQTIVILLFSPSTVPFSVSPFSSHFSSSSKSPSLPTLQYQKSGFQNTFISSFLYIRSNQQRGYYLNRIMRRGTYTEENENTESGEEEGEDSGSNDGEGMKNMKVDGDSRRGARQKKNLTWQEAIEAIITPTTSNSQRSILLKDLASRADEITNDVQKAVQTRDIDSLLTDGAKAVKRQVQQDILPTLVDKASKPEETAKTLQENLPKVATQAREVTKNLSKNLKDKSSRKDLFQTVKEVGVQLPKEARNIFLRTPEGLETPYYDVLEENNEYEIRSYDSFTVCKLNLNDGNEDVTETNVSQIMNKSGFGFNILASYLFGNNKASKTMAMTTPVIMESDDTTLTTSMSFVMPSQYDTETSPIPNDERIILEDTPSNIYYAAVEFPGFATDGEVARQLKRLLRQCDLDGIYVVNRSKYSILQYNPPYTLPWLRKNELLIQIEYNDGDISLKAEIVPEDEKIETSKNGKPEKENDDYDPNADNSSSNTDEGTDLDISPSD